MKEEGDLWQTLFCVCLYLHALEAMLASCRPSNTARIFSERIAPIGEAKKAR